MKVVLEAKELTKRQWKICEAVHLGLDHYFLNSNRDCRPLTNKDMAEAQDLLAKLPKGLWQENQPWKVCKGYKKNGE